MKDCLERAKHMGNWFHQRWERNSVAEHTYHVKELVPCLGHSEKWTWMRCFKSQVLWLVGTQPLCIKVQYWSWSLRKLPKLGSIKKIWTNIKIKSCSSDASNASECSCLPNATVPFWIFTMSSLDELYRTRPREIAQLVKCLSCKCENLSSDPLTQVKKVDVAVYDFNPGYGEMETESSLGLTGQPA